MKCQKRRGKPRKGLKNKDGTITGHLGRFSPKNIPRKSRTKTTVESIVKKDQKFNPPTTRICYKKDTTAKRKEKSNGVQKPNIYYCKPISEYVIRGSIPDLDALMWDEDMFINFGITFQTWIYRQRRMYHILNMVEISVMQHSDSMNASTALQQFIKLYEKAVESRYEKEVNNPQKLTRKLEQKLIDSLERY
ncbi:hypothetical protein A4A49_53753 [Nicotiana attenuata]|uniref:Uncharacterized protein n=1 Tax=Nicotiana attenuata TaxID=49451 RepID=A0A1J6IN07_NICAT|nr:hypothetical protein A4A49_53753 [Nicotiana attenuata]